MVKAQQWINDNFSSQENKDKVKKLCIRLNEGTNKIDQSNYEFFNTKLEGELDLNGFKNLEDLAIWGNWTSTLHPITNLKIDRCSKLQKLKIDCTSFDKLNLNSNQKITTLIIRGCINLQKIEGLEKLSNLQNLDIWPQNSKLLNTKLQIPFSQSNWKLELGKIKEIQILKEKVNKNEQQLNELAKKIHSLEEKDKKNQQKIHSLEEKAKKNEQKIHSLEEKANKNEQQLKEIANMISPNITIDLDKLKQEIARLTLNELVPQAQKKKSELEQQINDAKNKVEGSFKNIIGLLLETQKKILGENDPPVQAQLTGQVNAYLSVLEGNLSKQELQALLDEKTKLIQLEKQIDELRRTTNQKSAK
ncbi:unnamed protein product [Rhizophagus irregularis]|nr:unnamed protein product [Rhizophagus irregularis]CAB5348995.1 unnamed protein product [Rhizophagus irregularis]